MNYTLILENDEHCDIKDVRTYFKTFRKQNINFVEILYTPYWIVNEAYLSLWMDLLNHREELVHMNSYAAVSCMLGMSREKRHALTHKYPSKVDIIEKLGYDCYSDDTLFLTYHGWKLYDEITSDDWLATINPLDLHLEFQKPINRVEKMAETTYTIESWYSKFEITENHNLFCSEFSRNKDGNKYLPEKANWHLDRLSDNFKMRRKGYSKDKHILSFPYNPNDADCSAYTDDFLLFLGGVISKGTFSFRGNKIKDVRVSQTNHGKDEFISIMNNLNLPKFHKYHYNRGEKEYIEYIWSTSNPWIGKECYSICGHGAKEKYISSSFLFSLSQRQCRLVLKTLLLGDGTKDKDSPRWIYYTASKQLALDVNLLAHLAGYEANILGGEDGYFYKNGNSTYGNIPMYQVSIREKELEPHHINLSLTTKNNSNIVKNDKKTRVVCFEVPNGTLVTMKDGKTACQGNCKQLHHLWRLNRFVKEYIAGKPYIECLHSSLPVKKMMIDCKRDGCGLSKEDAEKWADELLAETELICNDFRSIHENKMDEEMDTFLNSLLEKLVTQSLTNQLEKK